MSLHLCVYYYFPVRIIISGDFILLVWCRWFSLLFFASVERIVFMQMWFLVSTATCICVCLHHPDDEYVFDYRGQFVYCNIARVIRLFSALCRFYFSLFNIIWNNRHCCYKFSLWYNNNNACSFWLFY